MKKEKTLLSIDEAYIHPDWQKWGLEQALLHNDATQEATKSTSNGNSRTEKAMTHSISEQTLEEIFFD